MRCLVIIFTFCCSQILLAQTQSFDNWFSSSLSYEVTKDFKVSSEQGIRFSEFQTDLSYHDLTLKYKVTDYFRAAFTWRYGGTGNTFNVEHFDNRLQIDLEGRYKLKPVMFVLRTRFQSKYRDMYSSRFGLHPTSYMRNRLAIRYQDFKKFEPEIGFESYYSLNNEEGNYIDKVRLYVGVDFNLGNAHSVGLTYIMQPELFANNPNTSHIISVGYGLSISDLLKKDKKPKNKPEEIAPKQTINWYRLP